jgi:hypothetical protein
MSNTVSVLCPDGKTRQATITSVDCLHTNISLRLGHNQKSYKGILVDGKFMPRAGGTNGMFFKNIPVEFRHWV